jgi:hypothetical protein
MPERHLLAIPLPHGRVGNTGFLTVYFAPRLREQGPLSDYPEWDPWPDTVNAMAINVAIDGVPQVPARVTPLAEPAAWQAVFRSQTPVSGHRPKDWRSTPLQPGPGGDFSEAILALYASFAERYPQGPPPGDEAVTLPEADVITGAAAQLARAYGSPMPAKDGERIAEPRDPEWDFHEYVSLLGHHPQLLRILGIAVELQVDLPANPATVRVHTNYGNGSDRFAVDFVMHTTPDFWSEPNPDPKLREQEGGFLRLAEQKAFLSIIDTMPSADRLRDLDERWPGRDGTLPALRTRALTLVRPDLVTAFRNRTERQWEIEEEISAALLTGQPVELFAEDATIGHIVDVFEPDVEGAPWRSLFQRQTDDRGYRFPRDHSLDRVPDADEGWTTTTLVTELVESFAEPDPDIDDPFVPFALRRLDDQLYRWDGWSGAVRPPGSSVDGATGTVTAEPPSEPPPTDPVRFATHYDVVPGSLPRLRFGHRYLMRARCVDLSGDARPLSEPVPASALPPVEAFGRLEPIAAPFVVRRQPRPQPGVGDDARTVVLRSDYDVDDAVVRPQERLLFPAQVAPDLCELHGEPAGGVDPDSYRVLRVRDARDPDEQWERDPVTGEPIASGRRRQQLRYLSDPLAERIRAHHLGEGLEHLAQRAGTWPAVSSTRVQVVAGEGATETNPDDVTELRFAVAKADIAEIDLSYAPPSGAVEQFGLWHQLSPDAQAALRATVENGGHWMFSARSRLTLVHAVRRPLLAPRLAPPTDAEPGPAWTATRAVQSTGVVYSATAEIERRSTARLTVRARWTDLVDDLRLPGPAPRRSGAPLGEFFTARDETSPPRFEIVDHRAELGDTRRHAATITMEAFSSFSAYFTEERQVVLDKTPVVVDRRGIARGTALVTAKRGRDAAEGDDYVLDQRAGTIAVVPSGRLHPGDEVTVRYVPLPVSRRSTEHEPFEFVFPSTVAPPPPQVVDVVAAFARTRTEDSDSVELRHDGAVLRLYLARPWNVSGDGEQLAVLVERTPGDVPAASCLGRDPIVTGSATPLTAAALTRSTAVAVSPDGRHDLALHDVAYDAGSSRWFVDIAVDTAMYRPFLRLVVARYQVDSIPGQQLSTSVMLDPVRLGVARSTTVRALGSEAFEVTMVGPDHGGMDADDGAGALLVNEVEVTHQRADPDIADDLLRWQLDVESRTLLRSSDGSAATWTGAIDVPADGSPRRLVLTEREPALFGDGVPVVGSEVVYTEVVDVGAAVASAVADP